MQNNETRKLGQMLDEAKKAMQDFDDFLITQEQPLVQTQSKQENTFMGLPIVTLTPQEFKSQKECDAFFTRQVAKIQNKQQNTFMGLPIVTLTPQKIEEPIEGIHFFITDEKIREEFYSKRNTHKDRVMQSIAEPSKKRSFDSSKDELTAVDESIKRVTTPLSPKFIESANRNIDKPKGKSARFSLNF